MGAETFVVTVCNSVFVAVVYSYFSSEENLVFDWSGNSSLDAMQLWDIQ